MDWPHGVAAFAHMMSLAFQASVILAFAVSGLAFPWASACFAAMNVLFIAYHLKELDK